MGFDKCELPFRARYSSRDGCTLFSKSLRELRFSVSEASGVISYDSFMKTTTLPLKNSMNRGSSHLAFLLIPFALAYFSLLSIAQDDCQDACLTNNNTVQGDSALVNLTTGFANTAVGFKTLSSNTTGGFNTSIGDEALSKNTDGSFNAATGFWALVNNTSGTFNTAIGFQALLNNTTGVSSTAIGQSALYSLTTGGGNTAIGDSALCNSSNIAVGEFAGDRIKGSNNIGIGNRGNRTDSDTIRIGTTGTHTSTFIAGISGVTVADGAGVIVDADGHLGTVVSSERYKDAIKPMDKASEAILALQPITFRYKRELDPKGIQQFGLVAEEVEKVNPDLVACDNQGQSYTVRYEAVNAMLLNEFLKACRQIDAQQKQIKALTAGLQKVSAQFELRKPAPQTVLNNRW